MKNDQDAKTKGAASPKPIPENDLLQETHSAINPPKEDFLLYVSALFGFVLTRSMTMPDAKRKLYDKWVSMDTETRQKITLELTEELHRGADVAASLYNEFEIMSSGTR